MLRRLLLLAVYSQLWKLLNNYKLAVECYHAVERD